MRGRTLFWTMLLTFLAVVLAGAWLRSFSLSYMAREFFAEQLLTMLEGSARTAAGWASTYLTDEGWHGHPSPRERMPWFGAQEESRLWIVGRDGTVVVDTEQAGSQRGVHLSDPIVQQVLAGETIRFSQESPWLPNTMVVGVPIREGGQVEGAILFFSPVAPFQTLLIGFQKVIWQTAILSVSFAMLVAFLLSRPLIRPLQHLREFARRLGRGEFDGPELKTDVVEIRELAGALQAAAFNLHQSFAALSDEKRRVQMLLEAMGDGLVAVDEQGRVQEVNPVAQQLLGGVAATGQSALEAGFPEPLVSMLLQVGRDRQSARQRKTAFVLGLQEIRAIVSPVIGVDGEPAGAVAILQDITAESRMRRAQEIFVANVSHEMRAPLAALGAGVEAMHDGMIPEKDRERYLTLMLHEIERLRRLIDDLLELSRLDAGINNFVRERMDIAEVVREAVETVTPRVHAHGLSISLKAETAWVVANRDRIAQVVASLLDNAIRFTPAGGSLFVAVERQATQVQLSVRDTGVGIAPEKLPHIWDRFYKVDAARTRTASSGTGLGLAIARGLVEQLGGTVGVQSRPDIGSTFFLTLPVADGPKSAEETPA